MGTASQDYIRMRDREERKNHSSNHFCGQPRWYYLISFILVCLLTPNADHDPASSAGKRVFNCTPFGGKGILYADSPGDRASDFLSLASQATDPPTISPDSSERARVQCTRWAPARTESNGKLMLVPLPTQCWGCRGYPTDHYAFVMYDRKLSSRNLRFRDSEGAQGRD